VTIHQTVKAVEIAGKVSISNIAPGAKVEISGPSTGWTQTVVCEGGACNAMEMVTDLTAGDYNITIQSFSPYCYNFVSVTVTDGGGNPCDDKGGDADGDGVCADDDCDDNNPSVGGQQTPGTDCNDGNVDTENDVIQSDGCSCAGTPVGPSKCANRTVINTERCANDGIIYGFYIVHDNLDKLYTFENGLFMEFDDGTAMLTGHLVNNGDSQVGFDVNINLTGRTTNSPTGAAKDHACLNPDQSNFYYYADLTGTLMGTGLASGAVLSIRDYNEVFQVGVGANVTNKDLSFGASGWLKIDVQSQPSGNLYLDIYDSPTNGQNGDININLTGDGTECPNGASNRSNPSAGNWNIPASNVNVYPNPAQSELFINLSKYVGKSADIKVFNLYGQLVQEVKIDEISAYEQRLDMSNLQNGLYHLNIKLEGAQPFTKKILVSRLY